MHNRRSDCWTQCRRRIDLPLKGPIPKVRPRRIRHGRPGELQTAALRRAFVHPRHDTPGLCDHKPARRCGALAITNRLSSMTAVRGINCRGR
jgi:hypothetical protein